MEQYVYSISPGCAENPEDIHLNLGIPKQDSLPFLKALNTINASSFKLLLSQIMNSIRSESSGNGTTKEILNNLLILMAVNGNNHIVNSIMQELLLLPFQLPNKVAKTNTVDCPIVVKFRQEINSFHPNCLRSTIKSLGKHLLSERNDQDLNIFINNLTLLYEWDLKNKKFMRYFIGFFFVLF